MSGQRLKNEESDLGPTYITADFMGSQSPRGKVGRSTMAKLHLSCAVVHSSPMMMMMMMDNDDDEDGDNNKDNDDEELCVKANR